ncbi:hypothetical protein [Psychrobacter submarinus]|uniref:hypothetical protein n=1 Tax=Psychrobacter submarinus TaxID=154108 RepID=UPI0019180432|nr:hypothetical protein [Psychrobacter submarinus]
MDNFSIFLYFLIAVTSILLFFYTNRVFFKARERSSTIKKYGNISELDHEDLLIAKNELSKIGIDGKGTEDVYIREERVYLPIAIVLVFVSIFLAISIVFSDDTRQLGKVIITVSLILISSKFYELYRTSRINRFLSIEN